ncbi:MAG: UBA/THIF-type binding protein [Variovorax sp.]|nr:UBA/THIF-type binding protein [Variovorax sp.]
MKVLPLQKEPSVAMSSNSPADPAPLDRDTRQRQIIPPAKLAACHAVIIGVGAVGRQAAIQLAAVGISRMTLIDHDIVGVENLAPQAYWPTDIGRLKVEATQELCRNIHSQCVIDPIAARFRRSMLKSLAAFTEPNLQLVVFACVDSIDARRMIWDTVKNTAAFFADGRMSAEVIRVLAADRPPADIYYPTTLFSSAEAYAGSCTAKSTVYTASICAGLMLGQFTKWLRGLPTERDLMLNLLSAELSVA